MFNPCLFYNRIGFRKLPPGCGLLKTVYLVICAYLQGVFVPLITGSVQLVRCGCNGRPSAAVQCFWCELKKRSLFTCRSVFGSVGKFVKGIAH